MKRKKRRITEDELIILKNHNLIFRGICHAQDQIQVETSVAFANYLNSVGITRYNYQLFFKLLETNNKWIVDAVIGKREARLLFSTIKPTKYLIKKAFKFLTFWHPKQIYIKVLHAVIGIIECSYYNPDDGYKIYPLTIGDLNNLGKYLNIKEDQFHPENEIVLHILDRITRLGEYTVDITKNILSKHAFKIRFGYFDHTKKLNDIIPQVLLVDIRREENEINPSKEYIKFLLSKE